MGIKPWSERSGAVLGTLCKRGHDHGGGSYRNSSGCVQCDAEHSARWTAANKERAAETKRRSHRKDPARMAKMRADWKRAYPEKVLAMAAAYRESNRDKCRLASRTWARAAENRPKLVAKTRLRGMRKRRAMPPWVDRAAVEAFYAKAASRRAATGAAYEVDHIVPLTHPLVCGLHVPANLRVIPALENRTKGNRFEVV